MSESNVCECSAVGHYKGALGDIEGDEIVEVEVVGGGHLYCNIKMSLEQATATHEKVIVTDNISKFL